MYLYVTKTPSSYCAISYHLIIRRMLSKAMKLTAHYVPTENTKCYTVSYMQVYAIQTKLKCIHVLLIYSVTTFYRHSLGGATISC